MNLAQNPTGDESPRLKNIKRQIRQCRQQVEQTATRIRKHVEAAGKAQLESELAGDSAELEAAYEALRTLVATLDPTVVVPELR